MSLPAYKDLTKVHKFNEHGWHYEAKIVSFASSGDVCLHLHKAYKVRNQFAKHGNFYVPMKHWKKFFGKGGLVSLAINEFREDMGAGK